MSNRQRLAALRARFVAKWQVIRVIEALEETLPIARIRSKGRSIVFTKLGVSYRDLLAPEALQDAIEMLEYAQERLPNLPPAVEIRLEKNCSVLISQIRWNAQQFRTTP